MDFGEDSFVPSSDAAAAHEFGFGGDATDPASFAYEAHGQYAAPEVFSGDMGFGDQVGYSGAATHTYEQDMEAVSKMEQEEESDAFAHLGTDGNNKLAEFNARWHQEHLEKDEQERSLKAQRRQAGRDALNAHLDAKRLQISKRKENNRLAELQHERNVEAALAGESWQRVSTMVDLTTADASTADVSRMKDVLIQLKARGLPPVA